MEVFRRILRYAKGIGHGKGYGIQSPFAYTLVRDVLVNPYIYYKYVELDREYPFLTRQERIIAHLLFRLANRLQAPNVFISPALPDHFAHYIQAGANHSRINAGQGKCEWAILPPNTNEVSSYLQTATDGNTLVVTDIYNAGRPTSAWQQILTSGAPVTTFDLYHLGIVFIDSHRVRADYIINI